MAFKNYAKKASRKYKGKYVGSFMPANRYKALKKQAAYASASIGRKRIRTRRAKIFQGMAKGLVGKRVMNMARVNALMRATVGSRPKVFNNRVASTIASFLGEL